MEGADLVSYPCCSSTPAKGTSKMNAKMALAAFSVSLSFGAVAYGDNEASISSNKAPRVVTDVICDNEYAMAMETAILEGNIPRMTELLSEKGRSVDDVLAIGGGCFRFDDKVFKYYQPYKQETSQTSYSSYSTAGSLGGQMGVYNGQAFTGSYGGSSFNHAYMPFGTYSGGMNYPRPRGDYYYSGVIPIKGPFLLGTPLMIAVRAGHKKVVAALLKHKANPNVFIKVKDYNVGRYGEKSGTWGCPRQYLCALFDCYMKLDPKAVAKADEIAKMLIDNEAVFIEKINKKDTDNFGRNALWDIARTKSTYLLAEILKCDFFKNKIDLEDNVGKSIADYCAKEIGGLDDILCREFMIGLKRFGSKFEGESKGESKGELESSHEEITPAKPITLMNGSGNGPEPSPSFAGKGIAGGNGMIDANLMLGGGIPGRARDGEVSVEQITHPVRCSTCNGWGWVADSSGVAYVSEDRWCRDCGKVSASHCHKTCPVCGGSGTVRRLN